MSFWFGTTEVADTTDLSNLFLGVLGPTVQKDGPQTNSSYDRMIDPILLMFNTERNSFAPLYRTMFINSNQNWGATAMALIK